MASKNQPMTLHDQKESGNKFAVDLRDGSIR
jgi:hypothetical protein